MTTQDTDSLLNQNYHKMLKKIKKTLFIRSFKELDKKIFLIMSLELALIFLIGLTLFFLNTSLKNDLTNWGFSDKSIEGFKSDAEGKESFMSLLKEKTYEPNGMFKYANLLKKTRNNLLIVISISLILISVFKTYEWNIITEKRFEKEFFLKYLALLSTSTIAAFILAVIATKGFKENLIPKVTLFFILIYLYFSLIVYPIFAKERKLIFSIKKTLKIGTKKFYKIFLAIFAIWIMIQLNLIILLIFSKFIYFAIIMLILYHIFLISWVKIYLLKVIENI